MAIRKPLIIIGGQVQEQPAGDTPAGAEPAVPAPTSDATAKYWRGDKTWRDFFTDVRAATLTGLSTATNAVVAATDTVLAAIGKLQAQVSEKFDKTGGTLTGTLVTKSLQESRVALSANDIDLATGNFFTKTIAGATALTVSNVPANGITASFILDLTNGGSAATTWWAGVKWAGGTAPTLTAAGRDVLGFFTHNGGSTWTGLVLAKDAK